MDEFPSALGPVTCGLISLPLASFATCPRIEVLALPRSPGLL